jgi:adenylate cyclase
MPTESERKFRLLRADPDAWGEGEPIEQGYLAFDPEVRVRTRGARAYLTIKGPGLYERLEFEYPIPSADAEALFPLCQAVLRKTRYRVGLLEIDVYHDRLAGLAIAEAEAWPPEMRLLPPEGVEWVEVTGDPTYLNQNLARHGVPETGSGTVSADVGGNGS